MRKKIRRVLEGLTYKASGVDIEKAGDFKSGIKQIVRKSFRPEALRDIGGFGAFFSMPSGKYREPVLVSSSDGVGTKLKIASLANKHDTVGIDAVAMNVNDILCTGAEPLFFLDYIAYSKLDRSILRDLIKGLTAGCVDSGCSLIGGETAQMPDMYREGEYDLAGFCVGVVEKNKIIDGSRIKAGDSLIGLESSGIHSNGYSLVRKVFSQAELKRYSGQLLKPTRIYVKPVLSLLSTIDHRLSAIHGISHITGGAFYDKIARILPDNVNALINKGSWPVPQIFKLMQSRGNIEEKEMYHTFNMGIGLVLMVPSGLEKAIISKLSGYGLKSWTIGRIVKGKKQVEII